MIGAARASLVAAAVAGSMVLGSCTSDDPTAVPSRASGSAGVSASPTPAAIGDVVAAVEERVDSYEGVSTGIIALVRVDDGVEVVTSGRADVRRTAPVKADDTFPVASLTKSMTAALVLQQVEEGRLRLDDRVRRWLPEMRTPVTVEQLLSHRSGLSDTTEADLERLGTDGTALLEASVARGPDFAPGSTGSYSNLGYAALGLVLERMLDRPLTELLERRIFGPAGMSSASLGGVPDVHGYVGRRDVAGDYLLDLHPAAGSVVASAGDVDAFYQALWSGKLLDEDTVADMAAPRGPVGLWSDYGLGLAHRKVRCGIALGHGGRIIGFAIEAWTLPGSGRSVVAMVNDQGSDSIAIGVAESALCD